MVRVITLPNGHRVTLGEYVRSWKILKTLPPHQDVTGFSIFPQSAAWILKALRYGLLDRINIRAGITLGRDMSQARVNHNLRRTVVCECRWCGQRLPFYEPLHSRFCDSDCRRSHSS